MPRTLNLTYFIFDVKGSHGTSFHVRTLVKDGYRMFINTRDMSNRNFPSEDEKYKRTRRKEDLPYSCTLTRYKIF